jgi:hypothetical protein
MYSRLNFSLGTKMLRAVLTVSFVLSAAVGSYIVATDSYLWAQAPTHAYGLIVFVAIDLATAAAIYIRPRVSRIVALLLPAVQLAAMAGDLYMGLGTPGSLVQGAFREYLLNDSAFMILLVVQAVLVGLAFGLLAQPVTDMREARRTQANDAKILKPVS